ncbi:UvrB/UvrC motif-containing protein [Phenylobacterium deserti]|uniref:UvrB/UvrC motif-containing protein n=1 Tax=Phenylobacterium deserti TaxID=1914756 RepID=UPI00140422F9|nr:UvrB/UvrC motif-containing protein [Phenylobacterium deserti]
MQRSRFGYRSRSMDMIAQLEARMAKAAAEDDFETAQALKDAIERLRRGESNLVEQQPGRMGLGSSQEAYVRDPSKPLPKKPDFMTRNVSPGGRRRR